MFLDSSIVRAFALMFIILNLSFLCEAFVSVDLRFCCFLGSVYQVVCRRTGALSVPLPPQAKEKTALRYEGRSW